MKTPASYLCAGAIGVIASAAFAGFASTETYLPSVGRIPGKFGAQFYSTVWATNLTAAPQTFTFRFLRAGQSNPSPPSFDDTLQPGETKVYENIVETKLGLTNALGAARITSSGEIFFAERIYDQEPGDDLGKTVGLFFAGVPKSFSISAGQSASIQGIDQGGAENFRYNFALIETSGGSADVNVQVFDGNGTLLGQKAYPLSPYEQIQPNVADVVPSIETTNARVTATVISGTGSVLLAGAQLANESQDSSGFEMTFRDSLLGTSGGTAGVTSLNGLTGALTLTPGSGISITPSGSSIAIAYTGGGGAGGITSVTHDSSLSGAGTGGSPLAIANGQIVRSVNGFHDAVTLAAGSNVTITPSGSTLTIASTGGGLTLPFFGTASSSGGAFTVQSDNGTGGAISGSTQATPTTVVYGLQGISYSKSPGSFGVFAIGGNSVFQTPNGAVGVMGVGSAYGVYGSTDSPTHTGVYGTTGGASGETGWAGVWGDSHDSTAVQGTSYNDRGVLGITNSVNAVAAIEGLNKASDGLGILGRTGNGSGLITSPHRTGIWGDSGAPSGGTGVVGTADGTGVYGTAHASGVVGFANVGVQGIADGTAGSVGVNFSGGLTGSGTKSFVEPHPTDPTKEIRYVCLEGRESGTYFRGTGRVVGGVATIEIPEDFRMVTRPDGLTVQLTPIGDLATLAAISRSLDRIVVRGSKDIEFDYMVNGVRRNVPELEPVEDNRFFVPRSADDPLFSKKTADPDVRALLIRDGVLNPDGTVNVETAHRLGWDRQESWIRAERSGAEGASASPR